jgi:hypothetical protein
MNSIDVISHINDVLNTNLTDEEKVNRIQDEVNDYFNESTEGDEE